jgi:DNA polymerase-4
MSRLILHLDLDAFYAAVEQRDQPQWVGRPVVVGAAPGHRGVVATCSYEARKFGVRSAMPISEAVRRLPPETVYVRPDMQRYGSVSRQVMQALATLSPVIEQVSIDEAFVDVTGLERLIGSPLAIGQKAKSQIRDSVGLTASVGIGPNRLIAKLASERDKPDGLTVVDPDQVQAFLDPMSLEVLRGVGVKTAPRLKRLGISSVAEVRRLPLEQLRQILGPRQGTAVYLQAKGQADDRIEPTRQRQSISKETTFDSDVSDPALLRESLRWAAGEVGFLARHAGLAGSQITLKVRLQGFETHTRSRTLAAPSADDQTLFRIAWDLYRAAPWQQRPVRLIGICLSHWPTENPSQPDLFSDPRPSAPVPRDATLTETLDSIRDRFGDGIIRRGLDRHRRR